MRWLLGICIIAMTQLCAEAQESVDLSSLESEQWVQSKDNILKDPKDQSRVSKFVDGLLDEKRKTPPRRNFEPVNDGEAAR